MTTSSKECGLAPYATKASQSRGRLVREAPSNSRTDFQRDRDRILHSGAFRKMRNKTQVFIESEGDYYRTRLTHSLEVAQIARSIARALGLNEDLTEAIALAHDLGHTCFGHAGEDGLDQAMKPYGGFSHNEQTFRILTKLEQRYARFDGLNLTWETLEGIAKHNGPVAPQAMGPTLLAFNQKWDLEPTSYAGPEAQVAAIADDIAYNTHDMDDGYRAGFFRLDDLRELPIFSATLEKTERLYPDAAKDRVTYEVVREVVGHLVDDVVEQTQRNLDLLKPQSVEEIRYASKVTVEMSLATVGKIAVVRKFLFERMYRHTSVNRVCAKAHMIVRELFDGFMKQPDLLPSTWAAAFKASGSETEAARIIADYIAGMTDRFAVQEHKKLFSAAYDDLGAI